MDPESRLEEVGFGLTNDINHAPRSDTLPGKCGTPRDANVL